MYDGNVAFKVTWVYGARGPFTTPCTAVGRENNIRLAQKVWCSQPDCDCNQAWRKGNAGPPVDTVPCYDSEIFKQWRFSGGIYHSGRKKDEPIAIVSAKPGKLAFFTTRNLEMGEEDRIVIGSYEITDIIDEPGWGYMVLSKAESRTRVKDLSKAPRFWKFHRQSGGPRWGTGLFRYLPDDEAKALQEALVRAIGR